MNLLIFICLIFHLNSLINCSDNFQLGHLCPENVFTYENSNGLDYEVNAILRTQLNIGFAPLDSIKFNYPADHYLQYFSNKEHAIRMAKLTKLYDDKIKEIYTENYINNKESFNNIKKDLKLIKNYYKQITHLRLNYINDRSFSISVNGRIYGGLYLVKSLDSYRRNVLESIEPRLTQFTKKINEMIMYLHTEKKNNLIYVLGDESIVDTFNYKLIQVNKFEFYGEFYGEKGIRPGTVYLNLILPFHDKDYKIMKTKNCIKLNSLPKFYQKWSNKKN